MPESTIETRAAMLATSLIDDIRSSQLAEDALFMTEAEIAKRHGVSRTIVREAVGRLRGLGILKSRRGKGLLVGRCDAVHILSKTIPFSGAKQLAELGQLRYVMEVGAIGLAVRNAVPDQIERLSALAHRYAAEVESKQPTLESELAFHSLLLEMSGNPLIAGMHQVIADFMLVESQKQETLQGAPNAVWQHIAIADAVRARDAELAGALLRSHLADLLQDASAPAQVKAS